MSTQEMIIEYQDDVTITFITYHKIMEKWWSKDWPLALALYMRYIEQVKRQGKWKTRSLDRFMMKAMWWSKPVFYRVKKILVDMELIEQILWQSWQAEVRVNFVIYSERQAKKSGSQNNWLPREEKLWDSQENWPSQVVNNPGSQELWLLNNKEEDNNKINNELNKSKWILTKVNIEQSSDFSDLWNLENSKNEIQEEVNSLSHDLKNSSAAGDEENEEFWNKEINAILKLLCKAVGIDEFKETQQRQRIYWKHFVNWIKNNWKQEFLNRLKWVLSDWFKAKNANSIAYLYHEIKSFIHSPVVTPVDTNKKPITFW